MNAAQLQLSNAMQAKTNGFRFGQTPHRPQFNLFPFTQTVIQ